MHRFDRVLIVDNGRVVADLPPSEVQASLDRGDLPTLSDSGRELVHELAQSCSAAKQNKSDPDDGTCTLVHACGMGCVNTCSGRVFAMNSKRAFTQTLLWHLRSG